MQRHKAQILPMEEVYRRRRSFDKAAFCWHFLAYSAIVFWAEVTLLLFSFLPFFGGDTAIMAFAPKPVLIANVVLAFMLTMIGLEKRTAWRTRRFRYIAQRAHPACFAVMIPIWLFKAVFPPMLRTPHPVVLEIVGTENEDDDDGPDTVA